MNCSKLLNACIQDSIDARAINTPAPRQALPSKQAGENATLYLNAAKALGCTLAHVAPADITSGKARLHMHVWCGQQNMHSISTSHFTLLQAATAVSMLRGELRQPITGWSGLMDRPCLHKCSWHHLGAIRQKAMEAARLEGCSCADSAALLCRLPVCWTACGRPSSWAFSRWGLQRC